jgi:hypothetical protein
MKKELSVRKEELTQFVEEKGSAPLLRPLVKEIELFDTFVSGASYSLTPETLAQLKLGDPLSLLREKNRFDDNAIALYTEKKEKLGYVPESDNVVFARLLDAGKLLKARISKIDKKGDFSVIAIKIYLVDF